MVNVIFNDVDISRGKVEWPDYTRTSKNLDINLNKLKTFQKSFKGYLDGNNLLVRLIHSLPIDPQANANALLNAITDRGLEVASVHGCYTSLGTGDVKNDVIFSERCYEVFIANLDTGIHTKGEDRRMVRCLRHPFRSLNFWTKEYESFEMSTDTAIFSLDIVEISKRFHSYLRSTKAPSAIDFITRNVFPEMLDDIVDITIFNRLCDKAYGVEPLVDDVRNPPVWMDLNEDIDAHLDNTLESLNECDGSLGAIAGRVMLREGVGLKELERFPKVFFNHNLYSIFLTSQLPLLRFILYNNSVINRVKLPELKNDTKKRLEELRQDKVLFAENRNLAEQQRREIKLLKNLL